MPPTARRRLEADAVSFLIIGPVVGAMLCSFGLWLVMLVVGTPVAWALAYLFGLPPAAAALAARLLSNGTRLSTVAPVAAGIAATAATMRWIVSMPWTGSLIDYWWPIAGGASAAAAVAMSLRMSSPRRVLAAVAACIAATMVLWGAWAATILHHPPGA